MKKNFLAFVCPYLKRSEYGKDDLIFSKDDSAKESSNFNKLVYFLQDGKVSYFIPEYDNFKFLKIQKGYYFGELDLLFNNSIRKYSIKTTRECIIFTLRKKEFKNIFFNEFKDIGMQLIDAGLLRKERIDKIYKEAVEFCKGLQKAEAFRLRTSLYHSNSISPDDLRMSQNNEKIQTFMDWNVQSAKSDVFIEQLKKESKLADIEQLSAQIERLQTSITHLSDITIKALEKKNLMNRKLEGKRISNVIQRKLTRTLSKVSNSNSPLLKPNEYKTNFRLERFPTIELKSNELQKKSSTILEENRSVSQDSHNRTKLSKSKTKEILPQPMSLLKIPGNPFFTPKNEVRRKSFSLSDSSPTLKLSFEMTSLDNNENEFSFKNQLITPASPTINFQKESKTEDIPLENYSLKFPEIKSIEDASQNNSKNEPKSNLNISEDELEINEKEIHDTKYSIIQNRKFITGKPKLKSKKEN